MRRILIDARRAQGQRTGVGHYTKSTLEYWPKDVPRIAVIRRDLPALDVVGRVRAYPPGPLWHIATAARVLLSNALYFSPESMIVPILVGKRSVLTIHDLSPLDRPDVHKRWNVFLHRAAMRLATKRVAHVIVPTRAVQADLKRHFGLPDSKVSVVYEGVRELDTSNRAANEVRNALGDSTKIALYVGTIEPRKNVNVLIESFLEETSSDWNLVIAGKTGWLSEEDLVEFKRLIAHPRVKYLGFVPDSWLPAIYDRASLFCYVSESEGFGLPVVEAMAAGVPVIVSDDPALVEVAGEAGIVVRRGKHLKRDLAAAFGKTTPQVSADLDAMSAQSVRASRRFRWENSARATADIIKKIEKRA